METRKMIEPLILKVTEENWLDEIVLGDPPLSKNELTLTNPGDAIKINLKNLLQYYDQNGDEWDGDKPTVKFSLEQDTDCAKISKGNQNI